jgi:ComF family protein
VDKSIVNNWLQTIQSWLLPPICVLCGARGEDCGLCAGCRAGLPWQANACTACALPLASGDLCGQCLRHPPVRDETVAIFGYAPPVDALVRRIKFNGDLACVRLLGLLMAEGVLRRLPGMPDVHVPDLIVPVPLHRSRLAKRGYNQAAELARPLARILGVPLDIAGCVRKRATAEQSGLDAAARALNLRDAFAARRRFPADIAIVDDVMTTGHTVDALARVLKQAGADRVRVWVCARALPPP